MSRKRNEDELFELHQDRALSEMDVGITNYGDHNVILEDRLGINEEQDDRKQNHRS